MAAARSDLAELRGILYYLENPPRTAEDPRIRRAHVDALRRLLNELEHGDPNSPMWWAAAALKKSMTKVKPGLYLPRDPALYRWALEKIFELFPDDEDDDNARH